MKIPKYVTDLTAADFADLKRATNPTQGRGIIIERHDADFQISINESELKRMIWAFLKQGGATSQLENLDEISMDAGDVS